MKMQLIEFYLEFRNDFLTIERFSEYHDIPVDLCEKAVHCGRELWLRMPQNIESDN
jgi:hypothetical protein